MGIENGCEVWLGHFVSEGIDVCEHGGCLGVGSHSGSELRLDAGESSRQLGSGSRSSFDLGKSFMEDFGNVQKTYNIPVLVTDRLSMSAKAGILTCHHSQDV